MSVPIKLQFILRVVWVLMCAAIFYSFIGGNTAVFENQERTVSFVLTMLIVTFPAGTINSMGSSLCAIFIAP